MTIENKGKTGEYVYDISLDGTVVNAMGLNVLSNTDGFNFKLPDESEYRYTNEHPYISMGLSRETEKGKKYTGFMADVAEFNDLYMKDFHYSPNAHNKMGLGVDEVVESTINFARKTYCDYFPSNPYPDDVKLVGNTIKSKKLSTYISEFLNKAVRLLLQNKGQEFLEEYYSYIDKIYNLQIPLRDIASKGKIKRSVEEYLEDMKTVTKAGRPKSRQAWYELVIKEGLKVNNGDTVYYVNTGKSKSHSDVKKVTHYYTRDMFGEEMEFTKDIEKGYKAYKSQYGTEKTPLSKDAWLSQQYPGYWKREEVTLNCMLVPREIIEGETDTYCSDMGDSFEYNVAKYVAQFNSRITPLLVCFSKDIRSRILITNPKDRPYFTEDECRLVSGEPNKVTDQDTYEQLMTMEDKEKRFWIRNNLTPPFFSECGMGDWEEVKREFLQKEEEERRTGIDKEREAYSKVIDNLKNDDLEQFIEDGELPEGLLKIIEVDPASGAFMSRNFEDLRLGSVDDLLDLYETRKFGDDVDYDE